MRQLIVMQPTEPRNYPDKLSKNALSWCSHDKLKHIGHFFESEEAHEPPTIQIRFHTDSDRSCNVEGVCSGHFGNLERLRFYKEFDQDISDATSRPGRSKAPSWNCVWTP